MKFIPAFCVATLCAPLPTYAADIGHDLDLSLWVNAASDYRSYGASISQKNPVIQGFAQLTHTSGIFLGLWGSNVDFGTKTRLETGYQLGYMHRFNDDLSFMANIARYEYPKESSADATEIYAEINYKNFRAGMFYDYEIDNHVPNQFSRFVGYTVPLPFEVKWYTKLEYNDFNYDFYDSHGNSRQGYYDWELKLSKTMLGVDWSVSYVDTDLSKTECETSWGHRDTCSAGVVFQASKQF